MYHSGVVVYVIFGPSLLLELRQFYSLTNSIFRRVLSIDLNEYLFLPECMYFTYLRLELNKNKTLYSQSFILFLFELSWNTEYHTDVRCFTYDTCNAPQEYQIFDIKDCDFDKSKTTDGWWTQHVSHSLVSRDYFIERLDF